MRYLFLFVLLISFSFNYAQTFEAKLAQIDKKYELLKDSLDKLSAKQIQKLEPVKAKLEAANTSTDAVEAAKGTIQMMNIYAKLKLNYQKSVEQVNAEKKYKVNTASSEKVSNETLAQVKAAAGQINKSDKSLKERDPALHQQMMNYLAQIGCKTVPPITPPSGM